jgi:prepilin-type processing-associated H-X9-DG protein
MNTRTRVAVTLIELVVVIGIVSLLMGLLLPAVQKVRAAAVKTQCANNLKQIGLALHLHHNDHYSFPPGVSSEAVAPGAARMSWCTRLLPYLEQTALWQQTQEAYRLEPSPFVNPPHLGLDTVVAAFACPADSRVLERHTTHRGRRVALTSFLGVMGTDFSTRDGVLFLDSQVRFADITDGTSNTVAVGERPPSADLWYGWWYASVGQDGTGSGDMLLGVRERCLRDSFVWFCAPGPYHFGPGRTDRQCDLFHFWSLHPGGAHFLFADGSVRFLAYSADAILPPLATRAGGEAAGLGD